MRRSLGVLVIGVAALATAACSGGTQSTSTGTGPTGAPAQSAAAGGQSKGQGQGADANAAATTAAIAGQAGAMHTGQAMNPAGQPIPQITGPEPGGGGNDGSMGALPHGTTAARAMAQGLGSDGVPVISVVNTDTSCIPDKTTVPAGRVWLKVTNHGKKITEMYLESAQGEELVEVEKITTGKAGAFRTTVKPGTYRIACEPGMADNQIYTPLTVTGM